MTTYLIILCTLSIAAFHGFSNDRPKTDKKD